MNFSKRTEWDLSENDFALAVRNAKLAGTSLLDLTMSNPTACGFEYPSTALQAAVIAEASFAYEPLPFGTLDAREGVSRYYSDHGVEVSAEKICLTTSTSEAYSFLFRLLCDPGDEVLIAAPSYPLFDFIAELDGVRLKLYPLFYDGGWQINFHFLQANVTSRTRAVVVVHPNNPTGNYASQYERRALDEFCAQQGLALIVDEVFLDYPLEAQEPTFLTHESRALTFVLSGISKVCALPQMKLSWIVANGPEAAVKKALARLEMIADTFLSVNTLTQSLLPDWLASRAVLQQQIKLRISTNLQWLDAQLQGSSADRLALGGGWTVVLRVPRHVADLAFAEAALQRGVVVQPGSFYGLSDGHIVLSLLTPLERWRRGLSALPLA